MTASTERGRGQAHSYMGGGRREGERRPVMPSVSNFSICVLFHEHRADTRSAEREGDVTTRHGSQDSSVLTAS